MAEKCFCHLNGYAVKDSTARQEIANLEELYGDLNSTVGRNVEATSNNSSRINDVNNRLDGVDSSLTSLGMYYDNMASELTNDIKPSLNSAKSDIEELQKDVKSLETVDSNILAEIEDIKTKGVGGGVSITYDEANESLTIAVVESDIKSNYLDGTYKFNSALNNVYASVEKVNFVSGDNVRFYGFTAGGSLDFQYIQQDETTVSVTGEFGTPWTYEKYRTVTFAGVQVSAEFYEWFIANAVKQ